MSIFFLWVRELREALLFWGVVLLITALSFSLGYRFGREGNPTPIVIEQCAPEE